jgi:hypothetical protein
MKDSGKRMSLAPWPAASPISLRAFSTQAARSKRGEAACNTATFTFGGESIMRLTLCTVLVGFVYLNFFSSAPIF